MRNGDLPPDMNADQLIDALLTAGLDATRATLTYPTPKLLDIAPAGIDRSTGVSCALSSMGVAPANTITLGDMPIDLPMFQLGGYTVAVANGHPDVLAAAMAITDSVDDDGFSRLLTDLGVIGGGSRSSRP
jgi:hydroxymethylpyrimidine pyrophosphatase-like HAD family hydrolase